MNYELINTILWMIIAILAIIIIAGADLVLQRIKLIKELLTCMLLLVFTWITTPLAFIILVLWGIIRYLFELLPRPQRSFDDYGTHKKLYWSLHWMGRTWKWNETIELVPYTL